MVGVVGAGATLVMAAAISVAEGTVPTTTVVILAAIGGAGTTQATAVTMAVVSGPVGIPCANSHYKTVVVNRGSRFASHAL